MDGNDDDDAKATPAPTPKTVKCRTLFHYFKLPNATMAQNVDHDDKTVKVSDNNAVKNGLYKVDNDKSTSKPANPESAGEVVNKPASLKSDQMDCKFAEILPEELIHVQSINSKSEKLVAYKQLEDPTVDCSGDGNDQKIVAKARPISNFFKKMSKDEYKKEVERNAAKAVMTVRALVHSPEPPIVENGNATEIRKDSSLSVEKAKQSSRSTKKSKPKKSNVSRSSLETDVISVLEVQEDGIGEQEDGKISTSLFKRKPAGEKRSTSDDRKDDDTVDADFFEKISGPVFTNEKSSENVKLPTEFAPTNVKFSETPETGKVQLLQPCPLSELTKENESEFVIKRASSKRAKAESSDSETGIPRRVEKISGKLFSKRRRQKSVTSGRQTPKLEDVDIDFPSAETAALKPPETTTLFKVKTPKSARKKKAKDTTTQYDSDSIDIDVLATFDAKTFCSGPNDRIPESDESSSVFSALMRKPLRKKSPSTSPSNKENSVQNTNNAFAVLMAKKTTKPSSNATETKTPVLSQNEVVQEEKLATDSKSSETPKLDFCQILTKPNVESQQEQVQNGLSGFPQAKPIRAAETIMKKRGRKSKPINTTERSKTKKEKINSPSRKSEKDKNSSHKIRKSKLSITEASKPEDATCLLAESEVPEKKMQSEEAESSSNEFEPSCKSVKRAFVEVEPMRRSSIRIKNNFEEITKRQEKQKLVERELDEVWLMANKKRKVTSKSGKQEVEEIVELDPDGGDDDIQVEKVVITPQKQKQAAKKIASIFIMGKKANPIKMVEDPAKAAAKLAFLHSSVPQTLKDQMASNKLQEEAQMLDVPAPFPRISHVLQKDSDPYWSLSDALLTFRKFDIDETPKSFGSKQLQLNLSPSDRNEAAAVNLNSKVDRLSKEQIFGCLQYLAAREKGKFSTLKHFLGFLRRKLDNDGVEEEARDQYYKTLFPSKNVSLGEIEEQRMLRRRRRKSKQQDKPDLDKAQKDVIYDPAYLSSMQWTMKYAPQSADDVIGNETTVRKLREWLREWDARDKSKRKRRRRLSSSSGSNSSSDDFISSSSESDSDSEEDDDDVKLPNTALLIGPCGVGKTASVYALAREMGFKVLEVNASMGRSGKQVMANLREATQSHNVRKRHKQEEKQMFKLGKRNPGKGKAPSHPMGASSVTKLDKSAVILFEDVDVVFDELDEGFYSAVNSLIATTKRPIIFTTSKLNFLKSSRAQSLKQTPMAFVFKPVKQVLASKHLQLMALCEGYFVDVRSIERLVSFCRNNLSRSVLALNYWATSGGEILSSDTFYSGKVAVPAVFGGDDEMFLKIEKLVFGSGKRLGLENVVRPIAGCPTPFGSDLNVESLFNDVSMLRTVIENGDSGVFNSCLIDYILCNNGPVPGSMLMLKTSSHDVPEMTPEDSDETELASQDSDEQEVTSQESVEPDMTSQRLEETRSHAKEEPLIEVQNVPFKTIKSKSEISNVRLGLESLSACLEIRSRFLATGHDPDVETEVFDPDLYSFVAQKAVSKAFKHFNENSPIADFDLFKNSIRNGTDKASLQRWAQQEVLNVFSSDLTTSHVPMSVDLFPTLRFIAKSEDERKRNGFGPVQGKRSRAGRFLHYFQSQGIHLKDVTLAQMCTALDS